MNGETAGSDMWKVIIISLGKENFIWIAVQQFGRGKKSQENVTCNQFVEC